ncbi:MAG: PAS domain S-box protein [Rhizobiaceae bacterium]|nr:PAS domain S-box protein [Rhizobiaceae bacterium]
MLDTAVDGIVVIDERGTILSFNKACETLFGYRAAELLGRNVKCIMPSRYADEHDGYLAHYRDTGERRIIGIGREVEGMHRDGTVMPVELSVGEARTPEGRQFIGIIRDLRARRATEERMRDLQAQLVHMARVSAIDEMGAALAHELNQPLTALMLYLDAVQRAAARDWQEGDLRGQALSNAVREAQPAAGIVQRMRGFLDRGDQRRRAVDLRVLLDEAVELTKMGRRSAGVMITRDDDPHLPRIEADPIQVQQVFVNLLRNAFDAVQGLERPEIAVATRREGRWVTVAVTDNGLGIASEAIGDLFKAFSSGKRKGMGLGLAISRSIAQSHGGDLTVDPGGDGRGARFELALPLGEPTEEDRADG